MPLAVETLYWWLAGGALICALLFATWPEARTAARIIAQFFLTIALPVLVVLGALIALLIPFAPKMDPRVGQAVIAGLVIATGWLTTAIFAEIGKARQRAERLRDYHKAIYAEIGNSLEMLRDQGQAETHAREILEKMEVDAGFVPFIPREHHDHVYDAVIGDIDVLPRQTIDAIVAYYSRIKAIEALANDMRGETFKSLPQKRRMNMFADYMAMRTQAFRFGLHALQLIRAFSDGGAKAAEEFSNLAAARSAPSRESE